MIRFILRAVFWLTIVILCLPSDPNREGEAPSVTIMEVLTAARAFIQDITQICARNPALCETGEAVAEVVADKARYGIEQIQAYLEHQTADDDTLRPEDIVAPWQEPQTGPALATAAR